MHCSLLYPASPTITKPIRPFPFGEPSSAHSHVGRFGGEAAVLFAGPVPGDAAVVLGAAGELRAGALGEAAAGALETTLRFSAGFASAT